MSNVLAFEWTNPDGVDERWTDWEPLLEAYRQRSRDALTMEELTAEIRAASRADDGAVFGVLGPDRRLIGYACLRAVNRRAIMTQWFKAHDEGTIVREAMDALMRKVYEFAEQQGCDRVVMETRSVRADGRVPSKFRMALEKLGFRPAYVGLELMVDADS